MNYLVEINLCVSSHSNKDIYLKNLRPYYPMHFKKNLAVIYLIILSNTANTQISNPKNYKPLENNSKAKASSVISINTQYKGILENLPDDYKDKYKELYKEMQKDKLTEIGQYAFLFNDEIQKFFDDILSEIKKANPNIVINDLKFFISRDYAPNAHASLDGTIVFNLSLLAYCENESQVAFIICHELAHNQLKHAHKSVKKSFDALYSKEAQKAIKEIKKSEYNTYEKAESYLKNVVFRSRRHTRDYEDEADSMAIKYLQNTRFDATQSVKALLMLDKIDSLMFTPNFDLSKSFNTPQYSFKKSWIEEEETLFGKDKRVFDGEWDKDSLKTHPDCKNRAQRVSNALNSYINKDKKDNPILADSYKDILLKAEFENLIAIYDADKVDFCLYQTLKSLQKHPDNVFLHAFVGQCFNTLYEAQKQHTFSKIVSIPSKDKPQAYLPFLRFLNNMSLKDISLVGFHYLNGLDKSYLEDEFMLYTMVVAAKNAEQKTVLSEYKARYMQTFPKGKYKAEISKI
jgi:Peptidase family M48